MKIRNRTLMILGVTFIVLFALLFLTTEQIMANSFGELEDKEVKKNIERATAAIDTNIDSLATTATDWGHWDDTYYFLKGEYENYPENNLDIDSLVNLQANMMLFYDATGQIHYVVGVDLDNYEYTEVPAAVIENISSYEMLFSKNSQPSYASGMINT
nr:CHASE4 domain-containing protein [Methanomethylovorans sp.]